MSIFTKLTLRNLKLNKKRTIGTIIGIMLATSLICAVAGIITSLQKSMVATTVADTGYYHLKLSDVTQEDVEKFKNNRDIEDVNVLNDVGYSLLDGGTNSYRPYIHLYSMDNESFNNMALELVEGEYPKNSNEIAINEDILTNSSKEYKIGDTITLNIGDRYAGDEYINSGWDYLPYEYATSSNDSADVEESSSDGLIIDENLGESQKITEENLKVNFTKEFTIVGIVSNNDLPIRRISFITDAGYTCITNGLEEGEKDIYIALNNPRNCKEDFKEMIGLDMDSGDFANTEYAYSINYSLLVWEALNVSNSTMSMIVAVALVAVVIIMITSVYCIKNAFSISLTEKIKMYGMLSSVGATKKQIKKSVIQEGMILSFIGIPLGILAGILAVYILTIVVGNILEGAVNVKIEFSISILPIILSIILGLVTVYLSCLSAARKAQKITPLEAIRSTNDIQIKGKEMKTPKLIKKLFGMGGVIAYKNLKRSKKKYKTTVVSIAISVFVFIATSTLLTYAFEAMGGYYEDYDYNIKVTSASNNGEDLLKIVQDERYKDNTLIYNISTNDGYSLMQIEDDNVLSDFACEELKRDSSYVPQASVKGLNSEDFKEFTQELGLNYEEVKDKAILNDYANSYREDGTIVRGRVYNYKKSDIITGKLDGVEYKFTIAEVTNQKPRAQEGNYYGNGCIIINVDEYPDIKFVPTDLAINVENPTDVEQDLNDTYHDCYVLNIDKQVKFYKAIELVTYIFSYGFIAVITLIGVTNIFNTLTSNIELRQKEFAMLKSIGMTHKEFNRMVNLETIFYSFKALLYGIILGLIASFAIYKAFAKSIDLGFIWPIGAILISIVFVFIIVFVIMRFAIRKINKQNIIETIRKENV